MDADSPHRGPPTNEKKIKKKKFLKALATVKSTSTIRGIYSVEARRFKRKPRGAINFPCTLVMALVDRLPREAQRPGANSGPIGDFA